MIPQKLTPLQAAEKVKKFCAYQPRCHKEVSDKLSSYGVYREEAAQIISDLIEEDLLNEERFATQFAQGRFRIKQWGKVKIKYELKKKSVSDYCIKKALGAIDKAAYRQTFFTLADKKINTLKSEKNIFIKKRKLQDYLLQKGYETGLVHEAVGML